MRDRLLRFVRARLDRYARWQDAGDLLDDAVEARALELLEFLGTQTDDFEAVSILALLFWIRYTLLPAGADEPDLQRAIMLYRAVHQVAPDQVPHELRSAVGSKDGPTRTSIPQRIDAERFHVAVMLELQDALAECDARGVADCVSRLRFLLDHIPPAYPYWREVAASLAGAHAASYQLAPDPADLDAQVDLLTTCDAQVQDPGPEYALQLGLLGDALHERHGRGGPASDLDTAISVRRRIVGMTDSEDPQWGPRSFDLGRAFLERGALSPRLDDLDAAIEHLDGACSTVIADFHDGAWFHNLGDALLRRSDRGAQQADLDAAIAAYAAAWNGVRSGSRREQLHLFAYVTALQQRSTLRDDVSDCDMAVRVIREAIARLADGTQAAGHHLALGLALVERYLAAGDLADVAAAVESFRTSVSMAGADGPMVINALVSLANGSSLLHQHTADPSHLAEGVDAYTTVAESPAADADLRAQCISARADLRRRMGPPPDASRIHREELIKAAEQERPGRLEEPRRLDRAITFTRRALDLGASTEPGAAALMIRLARYLLERHDRTARAGDADEALEAATRAEELARTDVSGRAAAAEVVAYAWLARYGHGGGSIALDNAVAAAERAVGLHSDDEIPARLRNCLGIALTSHYHETSDINDLQRALSEFRRAAALTAEEADAAQALGNLGNALRTLAHATRDTALFDEAIRTLQNAAAGSGPSVGLRSNLGTAFLQRFHITAANSDLEHARTAYEEALSNLAAGDSAFPATVNGYVEVVASMEDPEQAVVRRAARLFSLLTEGRASPDGPTHRRLAVLLLAVFRHTNEPVDLQLAADTFDKAVELAGQDGEDRTRAVMGVAETFRLRFGISEDMQDLAGAAALLRRCLAVTPPHESLRGPLLIGLNRVLRSSVEASSDRDLALEILQLSREITTSTTIPARNRAIEARLAAAAYAESQDWRRAAEMSELVVSLLPLLAPDPDLRADVRLIRPGRVTADGAACWLNAGEPERAVVLLEQGRAVALTQAVATRTELAELHADEPELADTFVTLRTRLDTTSSIASAIADGPWAAVSPIVDPAAIAAELDALLGRIRDIPGHSRFLLPPAVDDLIAAADEGPIVFLNASGLRVDALALTPNGVRTVPLSGASLKSLARAVAEIHMAATVAGRPDVGAQDREELQARSENALGWLWDQVAAPILADLRMTGRPSGGHRPRLWWVVDAAFALLPLHAAGHHDRRDEVDPPTVLDRTLSSYTPTVRALVAARAAGGSRLVPRSVLAVAMPRTPGQSDLPAAVLEADDIAERFPATVLGTTRIARAAATRSAIVRELPSHSVAHFACHAHTDWVDPARSFLAIHDGSSPRDTAAALGLADVANLRLNGRRLAVLSACATIRPSDLRMFDEANHLGSGFMLAGFTHVVGTLWEVADRAAAEFTREFYEHLDTFPEALDLDRTASSTHQATQALRDRFADTPIIWAGHLHIGP